MGTTTLDDEYKKTLAEFAHAESANERYAQNTVKLVAAQMDGDEEVWGLSAEEAEKRARKYRLISAYALRGAAVCDDWAEEARGAT
jgi:hypothetical protein